MIRRMNGQLNYQVIRSKKRRRTLSIRIKEDASIVISVPFATPKWEIERFIAKSQSWIRKRLAERERQPGQNEKVYRPGERFLYSGEWYPLEIEDEHHHHQPPLRLSFGKFILRRDCIGKAQQVFTDWYKKESRERIAERIDYYSNRFQLFPKGVKITNARCRWGSCSAGNKLCFSWRVIMAPIKVLDYILIHELVHIKEKNHSKKFWGCLESFLPDYRGCRIWLKENGNLLRL